MPKEEKRFEVVKKYYFRKEGNVESKEYDWIGEDCFGLYPVELDGKLGFTDCNGDIIVPIVYDKEYHVNDSICVGNEQYFNLRKNNLHGLIKHDGTEVVAFQWEGMKLDKLKENLLPVLKKGKWGFVNVETGKDQIATIFDDVESFQDGLAPVCFENKWGMIDRRGFVIIKPKYLVDTRFDGEFAIVCEGGSYYWEGAVRRIVNSNWKIVNKEGYEIVTDCSCIEKTGPNTFLLTKEKNGKVSVKPKQLVPFDDHIIIIDDAEYKSGYITNEGKYSEGFVFDNMKGIKSTHYVHAQYLKGGAWTSIDYKGHSLPIMLSEIREVEKSLIAND